MKKLLALLLTLTMVFSLAAPALAAPELPEEVYELPEVNYLNEIEAALLDLIDVDYAIDILDRIPFRRTPGSWSNLEAVEIFQAEFEKWYPGQSFLVEHPMNNGSNDTPDVPMVAMDDGWVTIGDSKFIYYGPGTSSGSPGPYTISTYDNDPYQFPTAYKFRGTSAENKGQVKSITGVEFIEWAPTTWTGTGTATFPDLTIPEGLDVAGKTVVVLNTAEKNTPNPATSTGGRPQTALGTITAEPSSDNFYKASLTLQNANAAAVIFVTAQTADPYWHTDRQYWVPAGDSAFYRIPHRTGDTDIEIPVGLTPLRDVEEEFARIRALPQEERDALEMEIGMETNTTLTTVMCLKPAADPNETRTVWIGAHFDTHLYGGRNDNGSGAAMMPALAKAFKDIPTQFNIMFVNWDWEESGYGSSYFARQLMTEEQKDNFVAYLNLDMAATSASINDLLMWSGPGLSVNQDVGALEIPRGDGQEGDIDKSEWVLDYATGRKLAEDFTTTYNILNNFVYTSKRLGLGAHDIAISNGGSSDHRPFYLQGKEGGSATGAVIRPNMMNSMHMDWRPKTTPHPKGTEGLEIHWHKEGDDWANISRNRYLVSAQSLGLMLAGAAGAEGFALPGALSFNVTSDKDRLTGGEEYFTLTPAFENSVSSNAFTLNFKYDKDLFAFRNANTTENQANYGLNVLTSEETDDGWKLTVADISGYDLTTLGDYLFSTVGDAEACTESVIEVTIDYVNKDDDDEKLVLTCFDTVEFVGTVQPPFDLVDLSDLIDWFGVTSGDPEWDLAKYWDFNGSQDIDIYDIVYVAQNIA